jgi:ribosomal protein S18 acetylase RimI-like enzyme
VTEIEIRAIGDRDREWVKAFFVEHWGSPQMVYSRGIHHCDELMGFAAFAGEKVVGLTTYAQQGEACEIVSLDSLEEGRGIGSALLGAVERMAREMGLRRVWLITTNDNLNALRFYQKRGFELVQVYRNAVAKAREIKPQIPLVGDHGIPIRDELELEKVFS